MSKSIIHYLLALICLSSLAWAEADFLHPDEAFVASAEAVGRDRVRVDWRIAEGYYLYQSKFRLQIDGEEARLGELVLPEALSQTDPIFGEVWVYRHQVSMEAPLEVLPDDLNELVLKVRSQGCADRGICYPPQTQTIKIVLPSAEATAGGMLPNLPSDALFGLGGLDDALGLADMEDDILSPEQAFQTAAESLHGDYLNVNWRIAEGTYLYQDKIQVELIGDGVALGQYDLPEPDIKKDSVKPDGSIGDVLVYHDAIALKIPLRRTHQAATEVEVKVAYQGCADRGICYPPQQDSFILALPAGEGAVALADTAQSAVIAAATETPAEALLNQEDAILQDLQTAAPGFAILLSLGLGVLVAFTACMYPMIPILSSLIMGQGGNCTPLRAFNLSLAYTQGIALTFGVLGAAMALVGKELGIQGSLQTPWVLIPSALLFVGLALSMFGFYQIQMPSAIQSRLNQWSNAREGGSIVGVLMMGVLSALIVGPCGGPILLAVLAFAAQSESILNGFLYLWLFGTGMGLPLLLMGAGGGVLLPKAGVWMDTVKATGGVIMLGLAITFLERLSPTYIPTSAIMLMWGALLIVVAMYLGALRPLPVEKNGWRTFWQGLGLVLLIYGALFLIGVAAGGKDTLQPLKGVFGGAATTHQATETRFKRIKTMDDLQREVVAAKAEGKPVMLDFYADWCTYCKTMEQVVFPHPQVHAALADYVLLQADITRQDAADRALADALQMPAPPALYFWNRQGEELRSHRLIGNVTVDQLAARAAQVGQL